MNPRLRVDSLLSNKRESQRGNASLTVIIIIVFLSLVTVGLLTAMTQINRAKTSAIHDDAATQIANGVIEKARSAIWSDVGFKAGAPADPLLATKAAWCSTDPKLSGPGGIRISDPNDSSSPKRPTVVTQGVGSAAIVPSTFTVVRGQTYCIRTDVTWKASPKPLTSGGIVPAAGYGVKTVTATVTWYETAGGQPRTVRVESDRSPTIGEAVPEEIGTGAEYALPPAVIDKFVATEATNTYIDFSMSYKYTKNIVIQYSADGSFNAGTTEELMNMSHTNPADQDQTNLSWAYTTPTDSKKVGRFRAVLTGLDNSLTYSNVVYQGMAPTLIVDEFATQALWNNVWIPSTVTNTLMRAGALPSAYAQIVATKNKNTILPSVPDGIYRFQLLEKPADTGWAVLASSNVVQKNLLREIETPILACYQNNYTGDVTVKWQDFASTWSATGFGTISAQNIASGVDTVDAVNTARKSSYIIKAGVPPASYTSYGFLGKHDRTGFGAGSPGITNYNISYTVTESWGTRTATVKCNTHPDLTAVAPGTTPVTLVDKDQKTSFSFDSRNIGLGIPNSDSSIAAGAVSTTVKVELFEYTGSGPVGTIVSTVSKVLPSYQNAPARFITPDIQNPLNGGKYYFKVSFTGAGQQTRTVIFPYMFSTRDFTYNTNISARMFPVVEGNQLSIYEVGANGEPAEYISRNAGVGWASCNSMAADVATTRVYCVFGAELWRYTIDSAGNAVDKTRVGTSNWEKFRDIFFVQNFWPDGSRALMGVVGRDDLGPSYPRGSILAYKMDASGEPVTPVVIGAGWQNMLIQPIYDWDTPGQVGMYVAGEGSNLPPRIYPMANGAFQTPDNFNVEVTDGVKDVPNGWVIGNRSIAGATHNANNELVLNFDTKDMGSGLSGGSYTQAKIVSPTQSGGQYTAKMVPTNPGKAFSPRRPGSPGNEVFSSGNSVRGPGSAYSGGTDNINKARIIVGRFDDTWVRKASSGGWDAVSSTFAAGVRITKVDISNNLHGKLGDNGELQIFTPTATAASRTFTNIKDFAITGDVIMMIDNTGRMSVTDSLTNTPVFMSETTATIVSMSGDRYGYLNASGEFFVGSVYNALSRYSGGNFEESQGTGFIKIQVAGQYITGVLNSNPKRIQWKNHLDTPWQYINAAQPIASLAMSQERMAFTNWTGIPYIAEWSSPNSFYTNIVGSTDMGINSMVQSGDGWVVQSQYGVWAKFGQLDSKPFSMYTGSLDFTTAAMADRDTGAGMAGSLDDVRAEFSGTGLTNSRILVTGWTYDREVPRTAAYIGFKIKYSDGTTSTVAPVRSDLVRDDIGQVFPVAGSAHAYRISLSVKSPPGAMEIEAIGYPVGPGGYMNAPTSLGKKWVSSSAVQFQSNSNKSKCLDDSGAKGLNNDRIISYDCINYDAQRWSWEHGFIKLAIYDYTKCLDIVSGNPASGTAVQLFTCNGNAWAQKFEYDVATKALRNPMSGMCIDFPNGDTANFTSVRMWTCNGSVAQQFNIVKMP